MTASRHMASASSTSWAADATALGWAEGDSLRDLLDLPRSTSHRRWSNWPEQGSVPWPAAFSSPLLPTAAQHLDALAAAGFIDLDVPWRAFWSVLILAKNPSRPGI